jgi:vacuolar-type H+-ATPase subunit I/STV1
MNESGRQRWLRTAILLGVVYFVIGFASSTFAGWTASDQVRGAWRLLAFLTSGVVFAVHVGYEHFRLRNSPLITASHCSMAVAVGAFGLALAANIHDLESASGYRPRMLIALVAWPLLTAVPAFLVALVAAAALGLRRLKHL